MKEVGVLLRVWAPSYENSWIRPWEYKNENNTCFMKGISQIKNGCSLQFYVP